MTAVSTDVKTWSQSLPFRQSMPAGRQTQYFVVAVFGSLVIHTFLAFLLWNVITGRTAVEPAYSPIDSPLIVSLSTFDAAPHDEPDREVVPEMPSTNPPLQSAQSSLESFRSAEHKAEAERVVTSKDQEAVYRTTREVERKPVSETGTVVTSKAREVPGSEVIGNTSLSADATPSLDLAAAYRIAREVGKTSMSEYEAQELRFASRKLYLKNRLGIVRKPRPDCLKTYLGMGWVGLPFLLIDTVTPDSGCEWKKKWDPEVRKAREGQSNQERQKDEERMIFFKNITDELLFTP